MVPKLAVSFASLSSYRIFSIVCQLYCTTILRSPRKLSDKFVEY